MFDFLIIASSGVGTLVLAVIFFVTKDYIVQRNKRIEKLERDIARINQDQEREYKAKRLASMNELSLVSKPSKYCFRWSEYSHNSYKAYELNDRQIRGILEDYVFKKTKVKYKVIGDVLSTLELVDDSKSQGESTFLEEDTRKPITCPAPFSKR